MLAYLLRLLRLTRFNTWKTKKNERERGIRYSRKVDERTKKGLWQTPSLGARKRIAFLDGSHTSPARPYDKNMKIKMKTLYDLKRGGSKISIYGSFYINFDEFKFGGLHEKHTVGTWNFANHLSICLKKILSERTFLPKAPRLPKEHCFRSPGFACLSFW
jgi:hypothetical protein